MKTRILTTLGFFGALTLVGAAPTIPNPSFEIDPVPSYPGYGSITGWTAHGGAGLNDSNGPFHDNGAIPDGAKVAFIQSGSSSSLSTVISNLTIGQTYKVNFRVNARSTVGGTPPLKVSIDGSNIIHTVVTPVSGSNPYKYFAFDFTAAAGSQTMTLSNDASGDHTVLLDDFSIAVRDSGWSYAAWNDDASSGVSSDSFYTHAYNFGSTNSPEINGILFTGIPDANPSVGGSFSTAGLPNVFHKHINNVTNFSSHLLANDFLWGGAVQSITINGLTFGRSYVATIYSVGWETGGRAATFSVGDDRLTVNQNHFGENNGIRVSYNFTANSSSITLTYVPLRADATFHTYGFSVHEVPQPSVANPSFEVDPVPPSPGYGSITSWTLSGGGLNDTNGPFHDNGAIPHGANVAFIQHDDALSQVVTGFIPGVSYQLRYFENARNCCGGAVPSAEVKIGGQTIVAPHDVPPVGGGNPYREILSDRFVATAASLELAFIKSSPQGGDSTLLIDNVSFIPPRTARTLLVTNLADSGSGSLRQAIADARPGDTITFGTSGTNTLTSGELFLTRDLTIAGPGPAEIAISGNYASRVFRIPAGVSAQLSGLTIKNGRTPSGPPSGILGVPGGTGEDGGGVYNSGTLVLSNCVITANATGNGGNGYSPAEDHAGTRGGDGGRGGGIFNAELGTLTVIQCTVSANTTGNGGLGGHGAHGRFASVDGHAGGQGGFAGYGGGIYSFASLTLIASTISGNRAGDAGSGGFGGDGYVGFFSGSAGNGGRGGPGGYGGGILQDGSGSGGALVLSACTIYGNSTGQGGRGGNGGQAVRSGIGGGGDGGGAGNGGGLCNLSGTGVLSNCTISQNVTGRGGHGGFYTSVWDGSKGDGGPGGDGGGVYAFGTLTFVACTIVNNDCGPGGFGGIGTSPGRGGDGGSGGGVLGAGVLRNTLIATNRAGAKGLGGEEERPGGGRGPDGRDGVGHDLRHLFSSEGHNLVSYNDSQFQLMGAAAGTDLVPPPGSRLDPLLAPLGDYAGPTRTFALMPGSPAIDAGDDTLAITLGTDQRGAPRQSGAHVDIGAFEVQVPLVLNTNDSGPGSLRNVLLYGSPLDTITFDPALSGQTIRLTSGQLTRSKSFAINAAALAGGLAIHAGGNSRVLEVAAGADATLDSLTLMNGSALSGGAILVNSGGTLTLNQTTLSGNSATYGGGLAGYDATLTLNNSTFSGNTAVVGGGILNNAGTLMLNNSTVAENSAAVGGGLQNENSGNVMVNNSTLSGNSASVSAGGIQTSELLFLTNAIVAANNAPAHPNIEGPFSGANNLTGGNPLLAALGNYGGPTPTMPPLSGSPAIDAGADSVANFLSADQRGYPRLSGAHVDIGAAEFQVVTAANAPVLTNAMLQPDGSYAFSFTSSPDASFTVLASTNLSQWNILGPPAHNPPGQYQFTDPNAASYPARFYKVSSP